MVRFDVFANESIRLVITGVGEINAAAAVSNIGGAYGISPDDEILMLGVALVLAVISVWAVYFWETSSLSR